VCAVVVFYYGSVKNTMVKSGKEKGSVAAKAKVTGKAKASGAVKATASNPTDVYDASEIAAPDVHDIEARYVWTFAPFDPPSLQTLRPGVWLNDDVIHRFFDLLFIHDLRMCRMDYSRKRSIYFPSFFISKLLNAEHKNVAVRGLYDYKAVKNWQRKRAVDIFEADNLLIPINQGQVHWVCAVVSMKEKTISVLDSLGGDGSKIQQALLRFLLDEHTQKKTTPLPDLEKWRLIPHQRSTRQQTNGYDCGVFVCMFAIAILFDGDRLSRTPRRVWSSFREINEIRQLIAIAIKDGRIHDPRFLQRFEAEGGPPTASLKIPPPTVSLKTQPPTEALEISPPKESLRAMPTAPLKALPAQSLKATPKESLNTMATTGPSPPPPILPALDRFSGMDDDLRHQLNAGVAVFMLAFAALEQSEKDCRKRYRGEGNLVSNGGDYVYEARSRNNGDMTKKRQNRREFDHDCAHYLIMRNYLGIGTDAALRGAEIPLFFRVSQSRLEQIVKRFGNSGDPFYTSFRRNRYGKEGPCFEAKILLPLKCLAFGVSCTAFIDHFSMSWSFGKECCTRFNEKFEEMFEEEFLRLPTATDLRRIVALHKHQHGVDGMLGSLDCMHTKWKKCPVAWQAGFKGSKQKSGTSNATIVLEALADYHLWFWHVSYGYPGSMNDINVLNASPLYNRLTDGSFTEMENKSGVVPFDVDDDSFRRTFMLVDGIYPKYSRFMGAVKQPITDEEKKFSAWQEGARKDVERGFGVLQCRWQAIEHPIHTHNPEKIPKMISTCLILHNMCVAERVMGDIDALYDPAYGLDLEKEFPPESRLRTSSGGTPDCVTGISDFDQKIAEAWTRQRETLALDNFDEWKRLHQALQRLKGSPKRR
jgi:Plant transposon protein/Ulp1 protease family, C-terminal catalytic domain